MQITCFNDRNTWKVGAVQIAAAKLRFALGFPEETFYCPKCKKGNKVSKAEFQAAMAAPDTAPKPAGQAAPKPAAYVPSNAVITGQQAQPAMAGAGPSISRPHKGTVIVRSLRIRKGHSKQDEMVGGLASGQKVEVIATWTDGKDTWAQLGPDQWAAVVYDGKAMIDLDDE